MQAPGPELPEQAGSYAAGGTVVKPEQGKDTESCVLSKKEEMRQAFHWSREVTVAGK